MILVIVNMTLNQCLWGDTAGPAPISSHSSSALCGPTCMVIYCVWVLYAGSQMHLSLVANAETLFYWEKRDFNSSFSKHFCVVSFLLFQNKREKQWNSLCCALGRGKRKITLTCSGILLSVFPYYLRNTELSTFFFFLIANVMQFKKNLESKVSKKNLIAPGARPVR